MNEDQFSNDDEGQWSDYIWCLHCEQAYHWEQWAEKGNECPNCGASELTDGWSWKRVADINGYPEIPETGKLYPLYGTDS